MEVENPIKTDGLVTFKDLAKHMPQVPASYLKKMANDGELPCLRMGSRTLYSIVAIEQRLAELASQPSPRANKPRKPKAAVKAEEAPTLPIKARKAPTNGLPQATA